MKFIRSLALLLSIGASIASQAEEKTQVFEGSMEGKAVTVTITWSDYGKGGEPIVGTIVEKESGKSLSVRGKADEIPELLNLYIGDRPEIYKLTSKEEDGKIVWKEGRGGSLTFSRSAAAQSIAGDLPKAPDFSMPKSPFGGLTTPGGLSTPSAPVANNPAAPKTLPLPTTATPDPPVAGIPATPQPGLTAPSKPTTLEMPKSPFTGLTTPAAPGTSKPDAPKTMPAPIKPAPIPPLAGTPATPKPGLIDPPAALPLPMPKSPFGGTVGSSPPAAPTPVTPPATTPTTPGVSDPTMPPPLPGSNNPTMPPPFPGSNTPVNGLPGPSGAPPPLPGSNNPTMPPPFPGSNSPLPPPVPTTAPLPGLGSSPPSPVMPLNPSPGVGRQQLVVEPTVWPVGRWPEGMTNDGKNLWVAESGQRTLAQLNPGTGEIINRVSAGRLPLDMVSNPQNGTVFASVGTDKNLIKFSQSGQGGTVASLPEYPSDIAGDEAGVWVLMENGIVLRFDQHSGALTKSDYIGDDTHTITRAGTSVFISHAFDDSSAITALDANSLQTLWASELDGYLPNIAANSSSIYLAGGEWDVEGVLIQADLETGKTGVKRTVPNESINHLVADDDHVVAAGESGRVWLFSATDLTLLKSVRLAVDDDFFIASLLIHDGSLYISARMGEKEEDGSILVLRDFLPAGHP